MWNCVFQGTVLEESNSVEGPHEWSSFLPEWLKASSVNQKKLHKKLLLCINVGNMKTVRGRGHFSNVPNSENSQRKTQETCIWFIFLKTNSLFPADSPLLKLLIMQINVILVTVVPVKLVKILLEDLKNSFPWCVILCIFKAMCRDSSACSLDWF